MDTPTLADMLDPQWWTITRMFGAVLAAYVTVYMFRFAWRD